jgi:hypothetical protein
MLTFLALLSVSAKGQNIKFKNMPEQSRVVKILQEELNRYPKLLVKEYLHDVVFEPLDGASGLAYLSYMIVIDPLHSEGTIRHAIHHEFSSVLLNRIDSELTFATHMKFNKEFNELNATFSYYSTAESGHAGSLSHEESKHFVGFEYARVGFENDWNVTCEFLWTNAPIYLKDGTIESFWSFYENRKGLPVAKKIELALAFYQSLDKSLTKEFFMALPVCDF